MIRTVFMWFWKRQRPVSHTAYAPEADHYAEHMRRVRGVAQSETRHARHETRRIQEQRPNQLEDAMLKDRIIAGQVGKGDL